jgi:hypothetical protein
LDDLLETRRSGIRANSKTASLRWIKASTRRCVDLRYPPDHIDFARRLTLGKFEGGKLVEPMRLSLRVT